VDKRLVKLYGGSNSDAPSVPALLVDKGARHLCIHKDLEQEKHSMRFPLKERFGGLEAGA